MISLYPDTWQDLQDKVCQILVQCHFSAEVGKKIESIRSEIEIDVFAKELIDDRQYSIICECKYWKSNIPQLYVHALRTVVNDTGVNKAYIITTSDFQKGAIESVESTNVELISWTEFQKLFFKSWYTNYFSVKLYDIIKQDYDPAAIKFFDNFELIEKKYFHSLIEKYDCLQEIREHFPHPILKNIPHQFKDIDNKLPLSKKMERSVIEEWNLIGSQIPEKILLETNYFEFLRLLNDFAYPIYNELDKLNLYIDNE